jgi:VIT1/CCC1 family predicted Fe2+/Mn2+ transporter
MLKQGPVPRFAHGVVEYLAGGLLIAAPFLLGFTDESSATAVSIVVGVLVLLVAATSDGPTALSVLIPLQIHILIDFALGAFLIAAPFLFGFSDASTPTAFFIVLGVLHLLVTVATRFERPR